MPTLELCFKCKTQPGTIPSRDGVRKPLCKACFLHFITTTFRTTFHQKCAVPSATRVAVAVSGTQSSMALLELAHALRQHNLQKDVRGQIQFDFHVIHLSFGETQEKSDDRVAMLRRVCRDRGLPLHVSPLSLSPQCSSTSSVQPTDLEEAARLQLRARLVDVCKSIEAQHVLVGESGTALAVQALLTIIHGRGTSITTDTLHNATIDGVVVHRVLRDLLASEVSLFVYHRQLEFMTAVPSVLPPPRTLRRTTESFVHMLQGSFRSTVFNILQTVTKMELSTESNNDNNKANNNMCAACLSHVTESPTSLLCGVCTRLHERLSDVSTNANASIGTTTTTSQTITRRVSQEEQRALLTEYLLEDLGE